MNAENPGNGSRLDEHDQTSVRRRDFLNIAAISAAGVGATAATIPLIDSMNPSADVLAVSNTEVDISGIAAGEAIVAMYRDQPLFVRHLSATKIAEANAVPLAVLRDPQTLAERTKPGMAEWLITMGVCTHLGCVYPWAPVPVKTGVNMADIFALATVRSTIRRRAFAKAPRQRTCLFPTMFSCHQ
jgi:ubiquinol-cytochrome c reductase iron-sulfur subunit